MNYKWGKPGCSRKWHLFEVDANGDRPSSFSLCGKIGFYFGPVDDPDPVFMESRGPDDCAACWRKGRKISGKELQVGGDD